MFFVLFFGFVFFLKGNNFPVFDFLKAQGNLRDLILLAGEELSV